MHVRGELYLFGAIARTGRAPSQSTCEPIITTNVCSVGTPYVTLIVTLNCCKEVLGCLTFGGCDP